MKVDPLTQEGSDMMKTFEVHSISDEAARAIMFSEIPSLIQKMIRKAHNEGSKGRLAYAQHPIQGGLFDAAVQLGEEFEDCVRTYVGSSAWRVSFGRSINFRAPCYIFIKLT